MSRRWPNLPGRAEFLICVAASMMAPWHPSSVWPHAPILVGNDDTFNPKMNNVRKGLEAASREIVALCDAGIIFDASELCRAAAPLSATVGLVLALKAADAPQNFAAEMERAYIDGHQARFLFAADRLGLAVASGRHPAVARYPAANRQRCGFNAGSPMTIRSSARCAESASPRVWAMHAAVAAGAGLVDGVAAAGPGPHPAAPSVWPLVLWEPVIGWVAGSGWCGALVCAGTGRAPSAGLVLHGGWLAGEKWFMTGRGLAFGPRAAAAAMLREALAPALMAGALGSRAIYWRGTDLGGDWSARGDDTAEKSV
jgi:ceramide glucosyltransferase